ncbi:MAG: DJ-1/PfpI family protein [Desulfovibrionaceae bacterium]
MKKAHVLLFHGYADWEIGYILAELKRLGNIQVVSVGFSDKPVFSMGGLKVQPEKQLSEIDPSEVLLFILPGGMMWEQSYPMDNVHSFLKILDTAEVPIAAICAATTVLAKAGILQGRKHTSNSLQYLCTHVPEYTGQNDYVSELAVTDEHITTASGLGSIEFTMNIMESLDIATPTVRKFWYRAFKYGEYPENITEGE